MDKVLVIVVTYNAMQWIKRCFDSIFSSSIPLDAFVVDNGSIDGSQDFLKSFYPNIKFFQSDTNLGFGRANNIGLRYALDNGYDYVYLLNQDAWLMPNTIEILIGVHKANPFYGILSPLQMQANMLRLDENFKLCCLGKSNDNVWEDCFLGRRSDVFSVSYIMAAHWLISRDCLKKVGGFSPTFPHYGEDNNYANRTLYHEFAIGVVPNAVAVHDREYRRSNKARDIYMSYIFILIFLSDIYKPVSKQWLKVLVSTVKVMLIYKSLLPLRYLFRVIANIVIIRRNMYGSMNLCPFI